MNTRKKRNRALQMAAHTVLAALLAGCHTVIGPDTSAEVVTTETGYNTPSELAQQLNLAVAATAKTPAAKALAGLVEQRAAGRLAAKGHTLKPAAPDLRIDLAVTQTLFDKSGEFILLEGEIDSSITRTYDGKQLANDRLTAKGKRALGMEKAVSELDAALARPLDAWLDRACAPERMSLKAVTIEVRRTWLATTTPGSVLNAEYASRFVKAVSGMPGVLRCELTDEKPDMRLMSFRIVYLNEQYPQGLLNAVIVKHPDLRLKR